MLSEMGMIDSKPDAVAAVSSVLVVDDEAGVLNFVSSLVRRAGYRVLKAQDGEEALRLCEGNPDIDVLLTDLSMPGISGLDLAERFRALNPAGRVILMSGHNDELLEAARTDGVVFLAKPFTAGSLLKHLRTTLGINPVEQSGGSAPASRRRVGNTQGVDQ